jgi:hypothetical protein
MSDLEFFYALLAAQDVPNFLYDIEGRPFRRLVDQDNASLKKIRFSVTFRHCFHGTLIR